MPWGTRLALAAHVLDIVRLTGAALQGVTPSLGGVSPDKDRYLWTDRVVEALGSMPRATLGAPNLGAVHDKLALLGLLAMASISLLYLIKCVCSFPNAAYGGMLEFSNVCNISDFASFLSCSWPMATHIHRGTFL